VPAAAEPEPPAFETEPAFLADQDSDPAMADGMLAAPVPADTMEPEAGVADEDVPAQNRPGTEPTDGETQPEHAASPGRLDPVAAARIFGAASTPRRPVVFEEDDDLDVPDFLK
jgi:cell division protein FtsZ